MKLRFLFPVLFLVVAFSVPVYADEVGEELLDPDIALQQVVYIVPEDLSEPDYSFEVIARAPVTPSSTTGLKSIMLTLLGNYDVIVGEYSYTNTNGTVSYLREMQPDYVWLVSAGIFALVLYCVFRMGGAVLCKR